MRTQILQSALLASTLLIIGFSYHAGLNAGFYFDEFPSLSGLANVEDATSALEYVLSGNAGPSGRPLSLASFLINRSAWPDHPEQFLYVNHLLHLINALLVAWLTLRLSKCSGMNQQRASYMAVATSSLWAALPILASSTLLVVQRMTLLSATFVLLGLVTYLIAYQRLDRKPTAALLAMSGSITLFTVLATLSKENGALFPAFAMLITGMLPRKETGLSTLAWRLWKGTFFALPLGALVVLVMSRVPYSEITILARDFTAIERLLTQSKILWQYLLHAFVPYDVSAFGPFHDEYQPARSILEPAVLLSVTGWVLAIALATVKRHQHPWLSFAIFWYLGGHLLESTLIPLELYFEHRNYVPLIGPALALAYYLTGVPKRWKKLALSAFLSYLTLLLITLYMVTSLWGQPFKAAQKQYANNPESSRATGYLAGHFMGQGWTGPARAVLDLAIENDIAAQRFQVMKTAIHCMEDGNLTSSDLAAVKKEIASSKPDRTFADTLHWLVHHYLASCRAVNPEIIRQIIQEAKRHPYYGQDRLSQLRFNRTLATIEEYAGNDSQYLEHLKKSLEYRFSPPILEQLMTSLSEQRKFGEACAVLENERDRLPTYPLKRWHRKLVLMRLKQTLRYKAESRQPCREN